VSGRLATSDTAASSASSSSASRGRRESIVRACRKTGEAGRMMEILLAAPAARADGGSGDARIERRLSTLATALCCKGGQVGISAV